MVTRRPLVIVACLALVVAVVVIATLEQGPSEAPSAERRPAQAVPEGASVEPREALAVPALLVDPLESEIASLPREPMARAESPFAPVADAEHMRSTLHSLDQRQRRLRMGDQGYEELAATTEAGLTVAFASHPELAADAELRRSHLHTGERLGLAPTVLAERLIAYVRQLEPAAAVAASRGEIDRVLAARDEELALAFCQRLLEEATPGPETAALELRRGEAAARLNRPDPAFAALHAVLEQGDERQRRQAARTLLALARRYRRSDDIVYAASLILAEADCSEELRATARYARAGAWFEQNRVAAALSEYQVVRVEHPDSREAGWAEMMIERCRASVVHRMDP